MLVALAAVSAFLLRSAARFGSVGPGRMKAPAVAGPSGLRPAVIWATWVGFLALAVNALSLMWFFLVSPSIVAALLFWLMPLSLALGIANAAVYVRERRAMSRSSAAPRRWVVILVLSLSIVMAMILALCIVLFHGAQLGNLDPGGL